MESNLEQKCRLHENPFECPDQVISYDQVFDEYGLIIHDGGSSVLSIEYCPWCGHKLPESKRDRWFEELESKGFSDPGEQDIPKAYQSDQWYRS